MSSWRTCSTTTSQSCETNSPQSAMSRAVYFSHLGDRRLIAASWVFLGGRVACGRDDRNEANLAETIVLTTQAHSNLVTRAKSYTAGATDFRSLDGGMETRYPPWVLRFCFSHLVLSRATHGTSAGLQAGSPSSARSRSSCSSSARPAGSETLVLSCRSRPFPCYVAL